jgi:beta-glucosidase
MSIVDLSDKALLTTGADYWSTREVPGLGLSSIRVSDGPHGLRVQDDDNPDHPRIRSQPSGHMLPARRNSCLVLGSGPDS